MAEIFGLYVVVTNSRAGHEQCAEAAIAEDVRYVQLRMKDRQRAGMIEAAWRLCG
jgi:thiamine monophosphate synthase